MSSSAELTPIDGMLDNMKIVMCRTAEVKNSTNGAVMHIWFESKREHM